MNTPADKVLTILEFLASEAEKARVLSEISRELSLPPASCARILKSLVRRGYAEKEGSRGGYRLGPMAYKLSGKAPYMKDVFEAAAGEIKKCAESIQAHVLLGARQGDSVYKIAEFDGNPEIRIRGRVLEGLCNSATGWLLLAFSGDKEIENYVKTRGLPEKKEGIIFSPEEFKNELSVIKKRGYSLKMTEALAAFAFPVGYEGRYLGLGCSMLASRFKEGSRKSYLEALMKTAWKIQEKLEREIR
jgi:IclR family transcriptional regulator, KDG regulon repressor